MKKQFFLTLTGFFLAVGCIASGPGGTPTAQVPITQEIPAQDNLEEAWRFNVSVNLVFVSVSFNVDCRKYFIPHFGHYIDCTTGGKLVSSTPTGFETVEDVLSYIERQTGQAPGTLSTIEIVSSTSFTDLDGKTYAVRPGVYRVVEGSTLGFETGRRFEYSLEEITH